MDDWRAKFASTAIATFREIISDPDYKDNFPTETDIGQYAEFLLGDAKKNAPFYWKEWNNGEDPKVRASSSL